MLTRREFLQRGVVVVSVGLAMPQIFTKAVHAAGQNGITPKSLSKRTLVVIQMAGGNDGLNTIVPFGMNSYHDARPGIKVPDSEVLPLNGQFGMHPGLAKLKELWDSGVVAAVQGVGYPNPVLSHFRSMEIWQTASMDTRAMEGWLGRYYDRVIDEEGHLLEGVAIGQTSPLALRTPNLPIPSVDSLDSYKVQGDPRYPKDFQGRVDALLKIYSEYPSHAPYAALLDNTAESANNSSNAIQQSAKDYKPAVDYPQTPLGNGLKLLSQVISQDLGVRVCHIGMGGFDTHSGQKYTQPRLLTQLAEGLNAFYHDLEAHGKAQDVLIMTWSEFGRRVRENYSGGTDHGTAGPMFLIGGGITGGLYGEQPSLTSLDDGNLKYTTDFRSVYASILDNWLGAPSDEILGGRFERLPFISAAAGGG